MLAPGFGSPPVDASAVHSPLKVTCRCAACTCSEAEHACYILAGCCHSVSKRSFGPTGVCAHSLCSHPDKSYSGSDMFDVLCHRRY